MTPCPVIPCCPVPGRGSATADQPSPNPASGTPAAAAVRLAGRPRAGNPGIIPWSSLADGGEKMMQALADVEMTWVEKAYHEGRAEGRAEARAEGRVEGQRALLLRQLTLKFGELPEAFVQRLLAVNDSDVLYALSEQVLTAPSLAEIMLPEAG